MLSGYHLAFWIAAALITLAVAVAATLLTRPKAGSAAAVEGVAAQAEPASASLLESGSSASAVHAAIDSAPTLQGRRLADDEDRVLLRYAVAARGHDLG